MDVRRSLQLFGDDEALMRVRWYSVLAQSRHVRPPNDGAVVAHGAPIRRQSGTWYINDIAQVSDLPFSSDFRHILPSRLPPARISLG